ncbi:MAG: MarR family winged helix-turn-helix transcriptional regulator [Moorellales bacterium]
MRWVPLVGVLVRLAARLRRHMLPVLQAESLSGLEVFTLWEVRRRRAGRASELAEFLGVPPSTFTAVLDRLEARGLLERLPDPGDRRAVLVRGTPLLAGLLDRVAERAERELEGLLGGLPDSEYRLVVQALTLLDRQLTRGEGEEGDTQL